MASNLMIASPINLEFQAQALPNRFALA